MTEMWGIKDKFGDILEGTVANSEDGAISLICDDHNEHWPILYEKYEYRCVRVRVEIIGEGE